MLVPSSSTVVFALSLTLLASCAASHDEDDGATSSSEEDALRKTVTIHGFARDASSGQAVAGATLCAVGQPTVPCATTDASGAYALTVPAKTDLDVRTEMTGYVPLRMSFATGKEDFAFHPSLLSTATYAAYTQIVAGHPPDPAHGAVIYTFYSLDGGVFPANNDDLAAGITGLAGASVTLQPSAPVVYNAANRFPDATLSETSTFGGAGSLDVAAGTYAATVAVPATYRCNNRFLESAGHHAVELHVHAGEVTGMWTRCVPRP